MESARGSCKTNSVLSQPAYTTIVTPDDVLFGRGLPIFKHPGNVKFHQIVVSKKTEYLASSQHEPKKRIAHQIINKIRASGGRFLRELKTPEEAQELGIVVANQGEKVWLIVGEKEIDAKVKQALREGEAGRHWLQHNDISSTSSTIPSNLLEGEPNQFLPMSHPSNMRTAFDPSSIPIENTFQNTILGLHPNTTSAVGSQCSVESSLKAFAIQNEINSLRTQLDYLIRQIQLQIQTLPVGPEDIVAVLSQLQTTRENIIPAIVSNTVIVETPPIHPQQLNLPPPLSDLIHKLQALNSNSSTTNDSNTETVAPESHEDTKIWLELKQLALNYLTTIGIDPSSDSAIEVNSNIHDFDSQKNERLARLEYNNVEVFGESEHSRAYKKKMDSDSSSLSDPINDRKRKSKFELESKPKYTKR